MMRTFLARWVLGAAVLGLTIGSAGASQQVSERFQMPVQIGLAVEAADCSNAPGPKITLEGEIGLGGLGTTLTFRNNQKGTHTFEDETVVEATLVSPGEIVSLPKQPVTGGVGGNPFIWVQLTDGQGQALTSELFLGRCVQGSFRTAAALALPATAAAQVSALDCANSPGPFITLDGGVTLSALHGRLIFRNNDNPVGGPHTAGDGMTLDLVLLPAGESIQFPKQPVLGGVGGNPWISLLFTQGTGEPIGSEFLLGRCEQLSH